MGDADGVILTPEGSDSGNPTNNVARVLGRVMRRAGIPELDAADQRAALHSERHTSATRWARAGVALAHVQAFLGHGDVRLTSRVCVHAALDDQ